MHSKEWPLIIFTLAMQLAAGAFVLLWGFHEQLVDMGGRPFADRFTGWMLAVLLGMMVVGVMGATLHLGNPRNAYLAFSNWRTSWLSREMLLGMLFGGLVGLYALLHWVGFLSPVIRFLLGGMTTIVGLVLVFGIAKLYMLRTVPAWNTPTTPISFYATAVSLGSLVMGSGLVVTAVSANAPIFTILGLLALMAMGTQLATFALHTTHLSGLGAAAAASARLLGSTYRRITIWRLVLLTLGSLLFAVYAFQIATLALFVFLALGMVLVAEGYGRFLFYESYVRVGL